MRRTASLTPTRSGVRLLRSSRSLKLLARRSLLHAAACSRVFHVPVVVGVLPVCKSDPSPALLADPSNPMAAASAVMSPHCQVAVLCVAPRSVYHQLVRPDLLWDFHRDATSYSLDLPVVCHPPCGPWGRLRHQCRYQDPSVAPLCVDIVRRVGGVLEHPAWSLLWKYSSLPGPGCGMDAWGGVTVETSLGDFEGEVCKPTWIYVVGGGLAPSPPAPRRGAVRPVDSLSSGRRQLTPLLMAEWLLSVAAGCSR